jgi:serine/threonine protein kinase
MKLKIFNPDGVHAREIKGLSALKDSLPGHWFGYASFEMIGHDGGEIDLVICADDRLIVVEIKDWNEPIVDNGNTWETRTVGKLKSPVILISEKAKKLATKLKKFLAPKYDCPLIDHCVLLTGASKRRDLREESKEKTFELEYFKTIGTKGTFTKYFPRNAYMNVSRQELKAELDKFFSGARVCPQSLSYAGYKAQDDPCYVHPQRIYFEYFAEKIGAKGYGALLRRWDFDRLGNIDGAYLNKENRKILALREENAIGYLRNAQADFSQRNLFLAPIINEGRDSVTENFFELYDLPKNLIRLKEAIQRYGGSLKPDNRVSIARILLSHFAELHELEVTHRDIGEHCIWVNIPDKVSISGFATCSFPEQNTVSQIRETIRAGTERIPEDVLASTSDNYRKDVFLLGVVVHQIFFGKRPESPDGFPVWLEPKDYQFKRFWTWFVRCLDMDPGMRFPNAKATFEEFQRCDGLEKLPSVSEDDFKEFIQKSFPQPDENDVIIRDDDHGLVFRVSDSSDGDRLVKVWANARFRLGATSDNLRLHEFFSRIQKLKIKNLTAQQKILDFGLTRYGSFVSLQWEDGCTLDHCDFENYDDEMAIALVKNLVGAVAEMHHSGFYHGDLKPENVLLVNGIEGCPVIRLIDCIDFSSIGTDRRTSAYMPPEGETASTPSCDGYAVWKIVTIFLFGKLSKATDLMKSRISEILESMQGTDGGDPDLDDALRKLNSVGADNKPEAQETHFETIISMGGIDNDFVLFPDDRGLPVELFLDRSRPDCFDICITATNRSIKLRYDLSKGRIASIRQRESSLMDFVRAMKFNKALLRYPIQVLRHNIDMLDPLESLLHDEGIVAEGEKLIQESKSTNGVDIVFTEFEDLSEKSAADQTNQEEIIRDQQVRLEELWKSLIDAESSILPVVTIIREPVIIENTGIIVIPVSEAYKPFEFQDDEPIQIEAQDRDGQWRFFGYLVNRQTRPGSLAVKSRYKGTFLPPVNSSLRLENKASRASYEKRLGAIQKILEGKSVCSDLIDYFSCKKDLLGRAPRFTTRLEELGRYSLNEEQKEALRTALLASPLSMIQGPPGTGKTSVISALVHYIATQYRSARILVVSQSHEAIDHATEQIVKRFRHHSDEPSLVRIGQKATVSDNLISFHSESLQGEYRERFRLSLMERIGPVGVSLGLTLEFINSLVILRRRLVPILRELEAESVDRTGHEDPNSVAIKKLKGACRQLDPGFDLEKAEIETVYEQLEMRLADHYGETDLASVKSLRGVIDLALEWIQILEAPGKLDRFYVGSSQIVTGTCVGVGRWDLGIESETFDCVIIDEAARCGPGDLAIASQVAEQVILLGDHKQLPPFIDGDIVDLVAMNLGYPRATIEQSDFQRLFRSEYSVKAGRTLKTQYRMQQPIGKLVSKCFYPELGGLESGRSNIAEVYSRMPDSFGEQVTWIDTGEAVEESMGTSFVNRHEIDRIMELLDELGADEKLIEDLIIDADSEMLPAAIGIIAAYKAQADAIEDRIWTSSLPDRLKATCKVGTVDSYQGKENPIVIFSAVRCNMFEGIGFTRSWERINVSLSRARERLVIVGSLRFWHKTGDSVPLGKVARYVQDCIEERERGFSILKF